MEAVFAGRGSNWRPSGWFPFFLLPGLVRSGILVAVLFTGFTWLRHGDEVARLSATTIAPVRWPLLGAHFAAYALLLWITVGIPHESLSDAVWDLLNCFRVVWAMAVVAFGTLALISRRFIAGVLRVSGPLTWYSAGAALLAIPVALVVASSWDSLGTPVSRVTLRLTEGMLRPLLPGLSVDVSTLTIGTSIFNGTVAWGCSGLEGISLLVAVSAVWIAVFHAELRIGRALLLIPVGAALLFVLNAFRIAVLILVGNAGWPDIALHGFHSQAGWIAFSGVAFGMAVVANRSSWISTARISTAPRAVTHSERNTTADYLLPLMAILAAAMVSETLSGGFEWAYSLRVLAGAIALYACRRGYASAIGGFGWEAAAAGALVFVIWIAGDRQAASPMPLALADASAAMRAFWIATRIAGAVITVPLAEELAFRGYLMRRLMAENFDAVALNRTSLSALAVSSLIFGATHGARWPAGIAAGIVFGWLARRKGRLGDAIAAHAMANALLACYVLGKSQWQYW